MRSRYMAGFAVLSLCVFQADGGEKAQSPKLETWVGVLKEKPKDAGEKVIALFIPDAKPEEKEGPKEIALLAPGNVSSEAMAKHAQDKIGPRLKVEVKGVRTADGIEAYELKRLDVSGKPKYLGVLKPTPKGTKNELALGILEWEGEPEKAGQPAKPLLLMAKSAKEKNVWSRLIAGFIEKGLRVEVLGQRSEQTLEVEGISMTSKATVPGRK